MGWLSPILRSRQMPKSRQVKQQEAVTRNKGWAALSDMEKLNELSKRQGDSKKQIAKIKRGEGK